MRPAHPLFRFVLDVVAWYALPVIFLFIYVLRYSVSSESVLPHLYLVTLALLGLTLVRLASFRLVPGEALARLVASAAASTLLFVMIAYYGLVLAGLESWGRVISWELIMRYFVQAPGLFDALGISLPWVAGLLVLALLALLAAAWFYLERVDWTSFAARRLPGWLFALVLLSGGAVCALGIYGFTYAHSALQSEPVSLTFFPREAAREFQGFTTEVLRTTKLDRLHDAARAAYRAKPGVSRRNVILIIVDALRPDHMGVYGYGRDTTPVLSRLARERTVRKPRAVYASCAHSACGLLSLMSSKFAHELSERPFTLQEVLKRHGYNVHAILGGDHAGFYDLKKIYGAVDSYFDGHDARERFYINDDKLVSDHLASFPPWDGTPVMFQFHLMSVHLLGTRHAAALRYTPAASYLLRAGRDPEDPRRVGERGVNFYDNGVVQADTMIGALLEVLEGKGYLADALVVVTADHGESLGEHGLFQHSNSVREQVLRIPLLLISYGYEPARSIATETVGSQVDIAPTILGELGMPRPATWSGASLLEPVVRDFLYFHERFDAGLIDLRDTRKLWKYWVNSKTGEEHAFDLGADPGETRNAIGEVQLELRREWRQRMLP